MCELKLTGNQALSFTTTVLHCYVFHFAHILLHSPWNKCSICSNIFLNFVKRPDWIQQRSPRDFLSKGFPRKGAQFQQILAHFGGRQHVYPKVSERGLRINGKKKHSGLNFEISMLRWIFSHVNFGAGHLTNVLFSPILCFNCFGLFCMQFSTSGNVFWQLSKRCINMMEDKTRINN